MSSCCIYRFYTAGCQEVIYIASSVPILVTYLRIAQKTVIPILLQKSVLDVEDFFYFLVVKRLAWADVLAEALDLLKEDCNERCEIC